MTPDTKRTTYFRPGPFSCPRCATTLTNVVSWTPPNGVGIACFECNLMFDVKWKAIQ